jgi:hypothetical protein
VTGILDSIDGALRDFETSTDAMRWVPEDERKSVAAQRSAASAAARSGEWIALGYPVTDGRLPLGGDMDLAPLVRVIEQIAVGVRRFFDDVGTAIAPLVRVLAAAAQANARLEQRRHGGGKLAVDGRAYQRRLRSRRRRRR